MSGSPQILDAVGTSPAPAGSPSIIDSVGAIPEESGGPAILDELGAPFNPKAAPPLFDVAGAPLAPKAAPALFDIAGTPLPEELPEEAASAIFFSEISGLGGGLETCVPATEPDFPGTLPQVLAGTFSRCPPRNFRVTDVSPTQVVLEWDPVATADLRLDDIITSQDGQKVAETGLPPEQNVASLRTVLGYTIHRGTPGFVPTGTAAGLGNCVADAGLLTPGVLIFTDTSPPPGTTVAYLIATVIDDGF